MQPEGLSGILAHEVNFIVVPILPSLHQRHHRPARYSSIGSENTNLGLMFLAASRASILCQTLIENNGDRSYFLVVIGMLGRCIYFIAEWLPTTYSLPDVDNPSNPSTPLAQFQLQARPCGLIPLQSLHKLSFVLDLPTPHPPS